MHCGTTVHFGGERDTQPVYIRMNISGIHQVMALKGVTKYWKAPHGRTETDHQQVELTQ